MAALAGAPIASGSCLSTALIVSAGVARWNAGWPLSISYSVAPSAKRSERGSAGWPRSCSGDMYARVPTENAGLRSRARGRRPGRLTAFQCRAKLGQAEVEDLHVSVAA